MIIIRPPVQGFAPLTTTHDDNFDRANTTSLGASWGYASSLATADISSNQAIGSGDANCRASYQTSPSASRTGQFYKTDIIGIATRVGLVYNSNGGSASSWAVLSNSTTLLLGATSSTSSSNAGSVHSTITVPTVTPPKEMLAMFTADDTVDIYIDRVLVATHVVPNLYGVYGGIYVRDATDIVDNYAQGTWS